MRPKAEIPRAANRRGGYAWNFALRAHSTLLLPIPDATEENVVWWDISSLLEHLPMTDVQVLWWGDDIPEQQRLSETLAGELQSIRSVGIDISNPTLQRIFQPAAQPYITESELLTTLDLPPSAVSGEGDPIVLFRPLATSGTLTVRTQVPAQIEVW